MSKNGKIIVLLSGGIDSTTLLWLSKSMFEEVYAVSFDYGQRHIVELNHALEIGRIGGVKRHFVVQIPHLKGLEGNALTDTSIEVPSQSYPDQPPITTVPMRNLIFLSIAASYADVYQIENIGIGIHSLDSPYPDCRAEFASAAEAVINASSVMVAKRKNRIRVFTPFLGMTKKDIVRLGKSLGVPFEKTYSCYRGTIPPCGQCATCLQREEALKALYEEESR